jgi:hypothetical protein
MRLSWSACGAGLCWLGLGCAAIVDFPDDPQLFPPTELDTDTEFRCLNAIGSPTVNAPTAHVRVQVCDALRGCAAPVSGLTARLCGKLDVDCLNPLLGPIESVDGGFDLDVPTLSGGFGGYLEVSSASELCTSPVFGAAGPLVCALASQCDPTAPDESCRVPLYARALLFFNPPIAADLPEPAVLSLLSSSALPGIVRAAGSDYDPTTGSLFLVGRGCDGAPAAGMRYGVDDPGGQVTQMYMDSGVLNRARDATDFTGIGAFTGLPPGFASIEAHDDRGNRIGAVGVQVAPGAITYTTLVPSP